MDLGGGRRRGECGRGAPERCPHAPEAHVLHFKALVVQLLLQNQVVLSVYLVGLLLLVQDPRVRHRLREGAQPCERGQRAAVLAADERGRGDWEESGRAYPGRERGWVDEENRSRTGAWM